MPVMLRLARHGKKKNPYYRIVAANSDARRDGRFLEQLGSYDPVPGKPLVALKRDRVQYWLDQGAQTTHTVQNILDKWMKGEDTVRKARVRPTFKVEAAPAKAEEKKAAPAKVEEAKAAAPKAEEAKVDEAKAEEAAPVAEETPKAEA